MEALGSAASVVGVTSLALQLCEELRKVHDFWQSIREAPDDIAHISTEINLFMTWLTVIANNYQRQGFNQRSPNHIATIDTLDLCMATVRNMNGEVKDLESGLSKGLLSKQRASAKIAFRKNKTEKALQQIERMKNLLLIIQTYYIGEMQEAGFKSLAMSLRPKDSALQTTTSAQSLDITAAAPTNEKVVSVTQEREPTLESQVEMVSFNPKVSPQAPCLPQRRTTKQEERTYNFGLATLKFITTEQESVFVGDSPNKRRIPARRIRCDLRVAQWLLSRGFLWRFSGMYGNWQYGFRTFRYIPLESLIVDFCLEGDIANVQRMFDRGLASPFDRVRLEGENYSQDWSLLHFSIFNCHAHLCKFLIECGLGRGSASVISQIPILLVIGYSDLEWNMSHPAAYLETLRTMVHEGQYDPMEDVGGKSVMHKYWGPPTGYRWLLDQEDFLIDFEQTAFITERTVAGALIGSTLGLQASSCLEAAIAHGSELNNIGGQESTGRPLSLADSAALDLPYVAEIDDFPKRIKVLWDAGANFTSTLDCVFLTCIKERYERFEVKPEPIPAPPGISAEDIINHDELEDSFAFEFRPRTPKSLWRTWYPGKDLSVLELVQRHLDAWMEVLLEAGIDIAEYGLREDELHPEGLLGNLYGEARLDFEYGDQVDGCRIHVMETLMRDPFRENATAETSTMPGSWDFDDD